jgi:hypothetical protein
LRQERFPHARVLRGRDAAETALSLLRSFRDECERALRGLDATAASITEYGEVVSDANRSEYWRIVALFGESYYRAILEWAHKAIAILENKE